jgi:hypothetical protein
MSQSLTERYDERIGTGPWIAQGYYPSRKSYKLSKNWISGARHKPTSRRSTWPRPNIRVTKLQSSGQAILVALARRV